MKVGACAAKCDPDPTWLCGIRFACDLVLAGPDIDLLEGDPWVSAIFIAVKFAFEDNRAATAAAFATLSMCLGIACP